MGFKCRPSKHTSAFSTHSMPGRAPHRVGCGEGCVLQARCRSYGRQRVLIGMEETVSMADVATILYPYNDIRAVMSLLCGSIS